MSISKSKQVISIFVLLDITAINTPTPESTVINKSPIQVDCVRSTQYKGKVSVTRTNKTCQMWSSQYPHKHSYGRQVSAFPDGSIDKASNYCRDPTNSGYLWCVTTDPSTPWESCSPGICATNNTACMSSKAYNGILNHTRLGTPCQHWSLQHPHDHVYVNDSLYTDGSVLDASNYCRDPVDFGIPWCFTTNPNDRWQICDVMYCSS